MSSDLDSTPEEKDRVIRNLAERIHNYGMEAAAILILHSMKPFVYVGGQLGRFFVLPFLPAFGEGIAQAGKKFFVSFEQMEDVEKLIRLLEEFTQT